MTSPKERLAVAAAVVRAMRACEASPPPPQGPQRGLGAAKPAPPVPAEVLRLVAWEHGASLEAAFDARGLGALLPPEHARALLRAFPDRRRLGRFVELATRDGVPPRLLAKCVDSGVADFRRDPYGTMFAVGGTLREAHALTVPGLDKDVGAARWAVLEAARAGHTAVALAKVAPDPETRRAVEAAVASGKLASFDRDGETHVADPEVHAVEREIAEGVARLAGAGRAFEVPERLCDDSCETWTAGEAPLTREQFDALVLATSRGVGVLTGGPGTGKTRAVRALVAELGPEACVLLAPTGRAARNVGGSTVHARCIGDTSPADLPPGLKLLLVDEASMLGLDLARAVLRLAAAAASRNDISVLLVGDVDQLPPVDVGHVLSDLIESGVVPVGRLRTRHRFSDDDIASAAAAALEGRLPEGVRDTPHPLHDAVAEVTGTAEAGEPAQILVPQNATRTSYNRAVQAALRDVDVVLTKDVGARKKGAVAKLSATPSGARLVFGTEQVVEMPIDRALAATRSVREFSPGDRVMCLKNQKAARGRRGGPGGPGGGQGAGHRVCNGDVGVLQDDGSVRFSHGHVAAVPHDQLALAYASTVHKFQGSECDVVVVPLGAPGWDASLLYTAVTRAKRRLVLLGPAAPPRRSRPPRVGALRSLLSSTKTPVTNDR